MQRRKFTSGVVCPHDAVPNDVIQPARGTRASSVPRDDGTLVKLIDVELPSQPAERDGLD